MNIEIDQEVAIFIYRKVLVIFAMVLSIYRLFRKHDIFKIIFLFAFMYFLIFSHTAFTKISYDIFDKMIILFIAPAFFLFFSIMFFQEKKMKGEYNKEEKKKYYATLALFIITELLLIFREKIIPRLL